MPEFTLFSASTFAALHRGIPVADIHFRAKGLKLRVVERVPITVPGFTAYHGKVFNHSVVEAGGQLEGHLLRIEGPAADLKAFMASLRPFETVYGMREMKPQFVARDGRPRAGTLFALPDLEAYRAHREPDGPLTKGAMRISATQIRAALEKLGATREHIEAAIRARRRPAKVRRPQVRRPAPHRRRL